MKFAVFLTLVLVSSDVVFLNKVEEDGVTSALQNLFDSMSEQLENLKDTVVKLDAKLNDQQDEIIALKNENKELKRVMKSSKGSYPRTCLEILENDPGMKSGMYYIDPDGSNAGDPPIYVFCYSDGRTAITHDSANRINVGHCFDPGCYSRPVVYNATLRQISALMELSSSCYQTIRYDCTSAPFAFNNVQYAWWTDRNGNAHYYWDGNNEDLSHTCQCGLLGSCLDPSLKCNCDALAPISIYDEGAISNTDQLPITQLNFGRTLAEASSGEHTLGYLQCSGRFTGPTHGTPSSCADLWRLGTTLSGIYLVQQSGNGQIMTVYCNMTRLPSEDGQQQIIGYNDVKSSPVYFDAYRSTNLTISATIVNYTVANLNIGSAIDISTGKFIAPKRGIYSFAFNAFAGTYYVRVSLRVNTIISSTAETSIGQSLALNSLLSLNAGDQVYIVLEAGSLYETFDGVFTHFNGHFIEEDLLYQYSEKWIK